jgi:hypothetical protein
MKLVPGDKAIDPIVHEITKVAGIMEHEFPVMLALVLGTENNDAVGFSGPVKKFDGK